MLPLKLVRSLVLGVPMNNPLLQTQTNNPNSHHSSSSSSSDYDGDGDGDDDDDSHTTKVGHAKKPKPRKLKTKTKTKTARASTRTRTPLLLFVPTTELIMDTYRLATIARDMGMDLHPTPSLSHIIFTYPSSSSSPSSSSPSPSPVSSITSTSTSSSSSSSSTSTSTSTSTSSSSSVLLSLPNNAVPLPFPSLSSASLSSLRSFVSLSKGLFKLVFFNSETEPTTTRDALPSSSFNWDCCSVSLFSRLSGDRIETMDGFSRALAGNGWSIFKTRMDPGSGSGSSGNSMVYLFRKMEVSRVRVIREKGNGNRENRIRELRLPHLDFGNAPLRILQYIVLMTDDVFHLA